MVDQMSRLIFLEITKFRYVTSNFLQLKFMDTIISIFYVVLYNWMYKRNKSQYEKKLTTENIGDIAIGITHFL